jgi:hypothetical protein
MINLPLAFPVSAPPIPAGGLVPSAPQTQISSPPSLAPPFQSIQIQQQIKKLLKSKPLLEDENLSKFVEKTNLALSPPTSELANSRVIQDFLEGKKGAQDVLKVTGSNIRRAKSFEEAKALFDSVKALAKNGAAITPNSGLYKEMTAWLLASELSTRYLEIRRLVEDAIVNGVIQANAGYDRNKNKLNFHTRAVYTNAYSSKLPHDPGVPREIARALLAYHERSINTKTKFIVGSHGQNVIKDVIKEALPRLGTSYIVDPNNRGQLIPNQGKKSSGG